LPKRRIQCGQIRIDFHCDCNVNAQQRVGNLCDLMSSPAFRQQSSVETWFPKFIAIILGPMDSVSV